MKVQTPEGWDLAIEVEEAMGEPIAIAVLGHAMMADRRSMDRPAGNGFATTLRKFGIRVIRFDARGHGGSTTPPAGRPWSWTYDELVRQDLPTVVAHARRMDSLPVGVIGHSLLATWPWPVQGPGLRRASDWHVLMATNTWLPSLEPSACAALAKGLPVHVMRASRRSQVGCRPEPCELVQRMKPSPIFKTSLVLVERPVGFPRWCGYLQTARRVRGPILSVLGGGRRVVGASGGGRPMGLSFGADGAQVWRAGAGTHGLSHDPDHMGLVTDHRCQPLWEAVGQWVADQVGVCATAYPGF